MSREAFERNDLLISHKDMHAVLCIFFVFPFCFEDKLLQNGVVSSYDAKVRKREKQQTLLFFTEQYLTDNSQYPYGFLPCLERVIYVINE